MKTIVTISLPLALLTFCVVTVGGTTGEKGGSCQDSDRAICLYVRPVPDECQNDSQCPGAERCCCLNCRRACLKTVKAGVCPHLLAKCKLPLPQPKCTDDGDCPGKQKCCSLCGQKCMDPRPDVAENAGFCPFDPDIETQCGFLPPPRCSKDAECGENKKCCLFGCGVQCVKALAEKPGVCPNIKAKCRVPLDDPQCQSDKDCPKGKKCCNLCGKKCLDSEPDNTGFCPSYMPMKCPAAISSNCSQDSECQAGQKCCDTGCGKTCMKTSKEKSGFCPDIILDEVTQEVCNKCKHDKDCPGPEKCCPGAEGRQCLQISSSTVKAGTCPADTEQCIRKPMPQCQNDFDCTGNQKCCYFHCGMKCKDPESVKAGTCPADFVQCIRDFPPQCQSDGDCTGNQKCCHFDCGMKCKAPESVKAGTCPGDTTRCVRTGLDECQNDSDCTGNQKCCQFRCGKQCKVPESVKAGTCPADTVVCKNADPDQCQSDGDCTGNQKCCYFHCGKKCKAPESAKTGECPVPSTRCAALTKPQPLKCRQDSDCPGTQKCCTPFCTQECTDAILPAKTGECPVPSTMCASIAKPQPPKCRQDSDCPGTQKCCTPFCTQECTDAILPAKTGECPVPSTRCAALTKPQPPKCRQDSDCPGTQKCCTPFCTQECTEAILPEHAGSCPVPLFYSKIVCTKDMTVIECSKDSDCASDEKCCNVPLCQTKCVKAVKEKKGRCPPQIAMCMLTTAPPVDQCKDDSTCPGDMKCCNFCGLKCRNPVPDEPKPLRCFQSVECFRAPCPPVEQDCAGPDDVCQLNQNRPIGCMSSAACNLRKAKDPSVTCCSSHLCNVAH